MNYSQNNSNMDNPYTNQTQGLVRVCSNPNSIILQLNHESNLKGRIPYSSCTIYGFTTPIFKKSRVRMKSNKTLERSNTKQEILISKVTPYNPKHVSILMIIVPYLNLASSSSFFSFFFSFPSSPRFFSPKLRPNLVLSQGFLLKPCLAPKNPFFFWVKSL